MRRLFASKQAADRPADDHAFASAYDDNEDLSASALQAGDYQRGPPMHAPHQYNYGLQGDHANQAGGANRAAGYSSYGEVHSSMGKGKQTRANLSRKNSVNKAAQVERSTHRPSAGTSIPFQHHRQSSHEGRAFVNAEQPRYGEAQRYPEHRYRETQDYPPNSISERHSSQNLSDSMHNPHPVQGRDRPMRQMSLRNDRRTDGSWYANGLRQNPVKGDNGAIRANEDHAYSSNDEIGTTSRHSAAGNAHYPARADEQMNPPAHRAFDEYIDQYDDSKHAGMGREAGKDKMKRLLFGKKKQNEPTEKPEEPQHVQRGRLDEADTYVYVDPDADLVEEKKPSNGRKELAAPAWLTGLAKSGADLANAARKGDDLVIGQLVARLCAEDESLWSEEEVDPLFDAISHSEASSKEAVKALRKEFKNNSEDARYRAIRLCALMFVRTGDRFRLQVSTKRFLESWEDLYNDKRTSTKTRGRLLVVWSMLAHESSKDKDLQPIARSFNKSKPSEMPLNGVPLDRDHELFNLSPPSTYMQRQESIEEAQIVQADPVYQPSQQHSRSNLSSSSLLQRQNEAARTDDSQSAIEEVSARLAEAIRNLREECNVARSNAHLLTESLVENGLDGPLLPEFSEKAQHSQDFLSSQIPWASSQAEQSRASRDAANLGHDATYAQPSPHLQDRMTPEEEILQDLLDAHEKVSIAQAMLQEAQDRRREEEEEAQVLDRSMREMRMDRSALVHDPATGQLYHIDDANAAAAIEQHRASGSRSVSPSPVARSGLNTDSSAAPYMQTDPTGHLAPPMRQSQSSSSAADQRGVLYQGGPRPMRPNQGASSPAMAPVPLATASNVGEWPIVVSQYDGRNDGDDSSDIQTPIQPSEKALGKRRAFSVDDEQTTAPVAAKENDREGALLARPPPQLPH